MSLYMLASGALIGDPQSREGAKGRFTTATILANGDEAVRVSVIAFGDEATRLLEFVKGDALAVSGRARLTSWTGRDGAEKHDISLVAEQIAAAKPLSRSVAGTPRRAARTRRPYPAPRLAASGPPLPDDRIDYLYA